MSLYWKNKDKPRSCERCDFSRRIPRSDGQILFCYAANKFVEKTEGISDYINYEKCPFDEVASSHGNLIDKDAVIQMLKPLSDSQEPFQRGIATAIIKLLNEMPVIIKSEDNK